MDLSEKLDRALEMTGGGVGGPYPKGTPNWNKRFRENIRSCDLHLVEVGRRPSGRKWADAPLADPGDKNDRWPRTAFIVEAPPVSTNGGE